MGAVVLPGHSAYAHAFLGASLTATSVGITARGERRLQDLVARIAEFLVPVFFVLMGMRVDLRAFGHPAVLLLALLLTVAAIAGKQACALGAIGGGLDRFSIGSGMIPRGEVGLIFASIGMTLPLHGERIVDAGTYSAVVSWSSSRRW